MPRNTTRAQDLCASHNRASMRPQRDAAEYKTATPLAALRGRRFNEAAA